MNNVLNSMTQEGGAKSRYPETLDNQKAGARL
jgi:hypothetical protein